MHHLGVTQGLEQVGVSLVDGERGQELGFSDVFRLAYSVQGGCGESPRGLPMADVLPSGDPLAYPGARLA